MRRTERVPSSGAIVPIGQHAFYGTLEIVNPASRLRAFGINIAFTGTRMSGTSSAAITFRNSGRDLRAESYCEPALVRHDLPVGFADSAVAEFFIERNKRTQI